MEVVAVVVHKPGSVVDRLVVVVVHIHSHRHRKMMLMSNAPDKIIAQATDTCSIEELNNKIDKQYLYPIEDI
jgi:hypothetical protein